MLTVLAIPAWVFVVVLVACCLAVVAFAVAMRRDQARRDAVIDIDAYRRRVAAQAALARIHDGRQP